MTLVIQTLKKLQSASLGRLIITEPRCRAADLDHTYHQTYTHTIHTTSTTTNTSTHIISDQHSDHSQQLTKPRVATDIKMSANQGQKGAAGPHDDIPKGWVPDLKGKTTDNAGTRPDVSMVSGEGYTYKHAGRSGAGNIASGAPYPKEGSGANGGRPW